MELTWCILCILFDQNTNVKESEGSDLVDSLDRGNPSNQPQNVASIPSCTHENGNGECLRTDHKETTWMDACHGTFKKSGHGCSKVNENSTGALRYALHLRFLCPSSKKSSSSVQRCKSDPVSLPEGERRFYLYNDLRVVFPQRHSDADEGKVT